MTLKAKHDAIFSEEAVTDFAAGTLSPAKHLIVACQSEMSDDVSERIKFQETIAASFLDDVKSAPLTPLFMGRVLENLPEQPRDEGQAPKKNALAPNTLRQKIGQGLSDIKWRSFVPGVAIYDIYGDRRYNSGDRLYLLKARGGIKMPEHSHSGEEWTLILTGSYTIGDQRFSRGDLHIEDDTTVHSPHIDEGEDCICLVMTQGPLKMKSLAARIVQPFVGI